MCVVPRDRRSAAGSLLWGVAADGFRPDRWDVIGSAACLVGVALIMYAPPG
jgi:small multidrug resistance family-3 protein